MVTASLSRRWASLTANFSGHVRKVTRNGRSYLVAPMTLINPGVLSGSKGPLLYPPDEVARNARDWDGVPITVYHPHHLGQPVSVEHPGVVKRQGVGTVRNVAVRGGKLQAEGWFDAEKTKKVNPSVYNRLTSGDPIELSTGLFTDNEERMGTFRGRQYVAIARNYRPDHLAVLPDQMGACSIADGCGVLINRRSDLRSKLMMIANANQPSDDVSSDKACQILKDGTAQGHPLTEEQKKMFGAACGRTHNANPEGKNQYSDLATKAELHSAEARSSGGAKAHMRAAQSHMAAARQAGYDHREDDMLEHRRRARAHANLAGVNNRLSNKLNLLVGNWGGPPEDDKDQDQQTQPPPGAAPPAAGPPSLEATQPAEDPAMWLAKRVMMLAKQYVTMIQGGQMPQDVVPPPDPNAGAPPPDADDDEWPPDDDEDDDGDSDTEDQDTDDDNEDKDDDSGKPPWVGNRLHRKLHLLVNDDQSDQSSEATIISGPGQGNKLETLFEQNTEGKDLWGTDPNEQAAIESHEDDGGNCSSSKNCSGGSLKANAWTDAAREAAARARHESAEAHTESAKVGHKSAWDHSRKASDAAYKSGTNHATRAATQHDIAAHYHTLAADEHSKAADNTTDQEDRVAHARAGQMHADAGKAHADAAKAIRSGTSKKLNPSPMTSSIRNRLRGLLGNEDQSFKDEDQKDADEARTVELETDRPTADVPEDADEAAEAHDLFPSEAESKADEDDWDATDDWDDDTDYDDVEDVNKDTVSNRLRSKLSLLSR